MTIESFNLESDDPDNCTGNALCIYDGRDANGELFGPCCHSPWNKSQILLTKGYYAYLELTGDEVTLPDHFLIKFRFSYLMGKISIFFLIIYYDISQLPLEQS